MFHLSLRRLALFCFALTIGSFAPLSVAASKATQFQATINFSEEVRFSDTSPCFLIGTIAGDGNAGKLGDVHLASTDCIVPLAPTLFLFSSQQVVLTLNGGEIWATYGGTLSTETGAIHGLYFINGGTGRFAHATGAGTINGFESLDPAAGGTGQIQLRGTLSF